MSIYGNIFAESVLVNEDTCIDIVCEASEIEKERKQIMKQARGIVKRFITSHGIKLNTEGNLGTYGVNKNFKKEKTDCFEIAFGNLAGDALMAAIIGSIFPIFPINGVSAKELPKVRALFKNESNKSELEKELNSGIEAYTFKVGAYNTTRDSIKIHIKKK